MLKSKKILFVLVCLVYACNPPSVSADDSCCLGHGGDYSCNVSTSQLYCQDGSVSNQCSCHAAPTPTPTAVPTEIPQVSSPECPTNASFSSNNNACTCNAGYIVSSNACVTYVSYCQSQYGNNSLYDSSSNACACSSGYVWNTAGSACVTMDGLCNEKIGSKSYYNSMDNSCYCFEGYSIQNGQCQVIPTPVPPATIAPTIGIPIGPVKSVVIPTLAVVVVATNAPTKAPLKKSVPKFDLNKKVPGLNSFIAVKKKRQGFFESIFTAILGVIMKAFNI